MKSMIAVGALGGSGTRAVAQILMESGVFIGNELNHAYDNLFFTQLFKNPQWYKNADTASISNRLTILEKYLRGIPYSFAEVKTIYQAAANHPFHPATNGFFAKEAAKMLPFQRKRTCVGWKEPNTQVFLGPILSRFTNIKYVHVIRHGLDMAFSNNVQQLENWGWIHGIHYQGNETITERAQKQLSYWIASTQKVTKLAQSHPDNIFVLNHSQLCAHPQGVVTDLLGFCNLHPPKSTLEKLFKIPQNTGSNNRYKTHDLTIFTKEQIAAVKELGFPV